MSTESTRTTSTSMTSTSTGSTRATSTTTGSASPPSTTVPLSVLDLVPISSGSTARQALANSIDLAQRTEAAGYRRYWIAEHHLNPGVAGTTPALVISMIAAATTRVRVGSGAVQMGHQTPLSVVEQFGILDALHPGRIDLGLGRSGFRRPANGGPSARSTPPPRAAGPPKVC